MANGITGEPIAGTDGRVSVGGIELNFDKWQLSPRAADILTTNFESTDDDGNTWEEGITGIRGMDLTASGFWDLSQNPHTDPPNLQAGEVISNVLCYVSKENDKFFSIPFLRLLTTPVAADVNGRMEITITGKTNGKVQYPQ